MTSSTQTHQSLLLALRRLRTNLASHDRVVAETARLRESDVSVLDILHRDGPQTPTALARRTSTRLATMTGVLSRLERQGWIERQPDTTDRRSIRVHATSIERFHELYADDVERLFAVFDGWPAEQAEAFARSIHDLNQALEAPPTRPQE